MKYGFWFISIGLIILANDGCSVKENLGNGYYILLKSNKTSALFEGKVHHYHLFYRKKDLGIIKRASPRVSPSGRYVLYYSPLDKDYRGWIVFDSETSDVIQTNKTEFIRFKKVEWHEEEKKVTLYKSGKGDFENIRWNTRPVFSN